GNGELARRRTARACAEIEAIAVQTLRERMGDVHGSASLPALAERVVEGDTDPYTAAAQIVSLF
nr:methylmalonyl Co-A mutase-associated GTPase MeaB [Geodermatophilaceae bacterium]